MAKHLSLSWKGKEEVWMGEEGESITVARGKDGQYNTSSSSGSPVGG